MGDATGVGDDERRTIVRLGLLEGLDHVAVVAAEGHLRHVDRAVADGFHGQIFAAVRLAAAANLATAPRGVALDIWPPVFE